MSNEMAKYQALLERIKRFGSLLVAFSGGVDSALLAYAAAQALGERALAVTVVSPLNPLGEPESAREFSAKLGIRHRIFEANVLDDPLIKENSPQRCYYCKRRLFSALLNMAKENGIAFVADGENQDDSSFRRPGSVAVHELGVISPLQELNLTKAEIREVSRQLALPTWNYPSMACLANRFPYGTPLEPELLRRVGAAEKELSQLQLGQLRLRHHGNLVRVEISPLDLTRIEEHRSEIIATLKAYGYQYICLDLEGYRFGSADEVLTRSIEHVDS
jgi:uncharacterized protein